MKQIRFNGKEKSYYIVSPSKKSNLFKNKKGKRIPSLNLLTLEYEGKGKGRYFWHERTAHAESVLFKLY